MRRTTAQAVLTGTVAFALLVIAWGLTGTKSDADTRSSTHVSTRQGLRAVYLMLESLGLRPEQIAAPITAGFPKDRTFVVAAPDWPLTAPESKAILDWTSGGGRLVVIGTPTGSGGERDVSPLLAPLGLAIRHAPKIGEVAVVEPLWQDGVSAIDWRPWGEVAVIEGTSPDVRRGDTSVSIRAGETVVARTARFGSGEVVVVADPHIFTNLAIRERDAAVLAVRILTARPSDGGRVAFDEFHQGFEEAGSRRDLVGRLLAATTTTWPGLGILVLAASAMLVGAGAAVRFGRPIPEPPAARRALAEHAAALGGLLDAAGAGDESLRILIDGVRRTCAPRIGLPPHVRLSTLTERLRESPAPGAPELASALAAAIGAADSLRGRTLKKQSQFADAAAELAAARRRFLHGI